VNLPVRRLADATDDQKKQIEKNIAALAGGPESGLLLQELPRRQEEVRDPATEAVKRAIALCWVLHLVGDIHQPLHAAALFSKDSLKGDRGGNAAFMPWRGKPENLPAPGTASSAGTSSSARR
jgi:hypothetical protein